MKMFAQCPCYLLQQKRADLPHLQLHLKTVQLYDEAVQFCYLVLYCNWTAFGENLLKAKSKNTQMFFDPCTISVHKAVYDSLKHHSQ